MTDTAKVIEATYSDGRHASWIWHCPGCDSPHACDDRWTFNGNVEAPTFRASVLVHEVKHEGKIIHPRCHSFVTDGRIEFLADCSHEHAGKTVDLPAFREKHPGWSS